MLAADGIAVVVTPRVLNLARQRYYRWLANPVTESDLVEACRANALFNAHGDDPQFGYRFLADEARDAGETMAERTAWRICSTHGWFSRFGSKPKRGKATQVGPPVRDDLVEPELHRSGTEPVVAGRQPSLRPSEAHTARPEASSTSGRSRKCSPTASSATRSTPG